VAWLQQLSVAMPQVELKARNAPRCFYTDFDSLQDHIRTAKPVSIIRQDKLKLAPNTADLPK
jgi:hypothetical protein